MCSSDLHKPPKMASRKSVPQNLERKLAERKKSQMQESKPPAMASAWPSGNPSAGGGKRKSSCKSKKTLVVPVNLDSPKAAAPTSGMKDVLQGKMFEMEAVLRAQVDSEASLTALMVEVGGCLCFVNKLAHMSRESGHLQGSIFQYLLTSCGASMGALRRTPTNGAQRIVFCNPEQTIRLAMLAKKMIDLVRIKVEDDNDIDLVRKCLVDSDSLLQSVSRGAKKCGMGAHEYYSKLKADTLKDEDIDVDPAGPAQGAEDTEADGGGMW